MENLKQYLASFFIFKLTKAKKKPDEYIAKECQLESTVDGFRVQILKITMDISMEIEFHWPETE